MFTLFTYIWSPSLLSVFAHRKHRAATLSFVPNLVHFWNNMRRFRANFVSNQEIYTLRIMDPYLSLVLAFPYQEPYNVFI